MGRKVNEFCEVRENGDLYCEFPENKHDEEGGNVESPDISGEEVRIEGGDAPDHDIDVV